MAGIPALACGPDTDCMIGDRSYRIQMPEAADAPGAIIFAHGYRGSAAGTMRNGNLRRLADELGLALVAVKSYEDDWRIPGVPADPDTNGKVEMDYFEALIDVLRDTHGIDTDRLLVSGFSAGGMMVWQLACDMGDRFAGFAPISGTFWDPVPASCDSGPVHMFHTHGTSDRIVPLAGRPIAETHQGDVMAALTMLAEGGAYSPAGTFTEAGLACERSENPDGKVIEFCTHPGGHSIKTDYIRRAWMRLQALGAV